MKIGIASQKADFHKRSVEDRYAYLRSGAERDAWPEFHFGRASAGLEGERRRGAFFVWSGLPHEACVQP